MLFIWKLSRRRWKNILPVLPEVYDSLAPLIQVSIKLCHSMHCVMDVLAILTAVAWIFSYWGQSRLPRSGKVKFSTGSWLWSWLLGSALFSPFIDQWLPSMDSLSLYCHSPLLSTSFNKFQMIIFRILKMEEKKIKGNKKKKKNMKFIIIVCYLGANTGKRSPKSVSFRSWFSFGFSVHRPVMIIIPIWFHRQISLHLIWLIPPFLMPVWLHLWFNMEVESN